MFAGLSGTMSGNSTFGNPKTDFPKSPKKLIEKGHSEFILDGISYFALNKANAEKKHQKNQ